MQLILRRVCITSILRMTTLNVSSRNKDRSQGTVESTIWTSVEADSGIVCACLPTLKGIIQRFFPRFFEHRVHVDSSQGSASTSPWNRRTATRIPPVYDRWNPPRQAIPHKASTSSESESLMLYGSSPTRSDAEKSPGDDVHHGTGTEMMPLGEIRKQTDVDIRTAPWEPVDNNRSNVHLVRPQISFP